MGTPLVALWATIAALAAAVAALAVRQIGSRRALRARDVRWCQAHPVGPDGILDGAAPIALDAAGSRACLLLHGFGDTPQSLSRLAHALHAAGWTVRAPLLQGHGRTLSAFNDTDAEDWDGTARQAYAALRGTHRTVALVGLSMGGALATRLSVDGQAPAALVLLAPYLQVSRRARLLTAVWPLWALVRPWVPGDSDASIRDPEARRASLGYGGATPRLLRELRRVVDGATAASARVTAPTLVIFSKHDYRIPIEAARAAFDRLGAPVKEVHWVERSGHVITADYDADAVGERVVEWLEGR
ncbi:MAG: alpha/beta fold hydrolase [Gemmatimonadaceae bacterium]|nr:alpha/beta fold hydrolase [Gemmatimonadaceae bacterium]